MSCSNQSNDDARQQADDASITSIRMGDEYVTYAPNVRVPYMQWIRDQQLINKVNGCMKPRAAGMKMPNIYG